MHFFIIADLTHGQNIPNHQPYPECNTAPINIRINLLGDDLIIGDNSPTT
jgi:hypothetical protein